VTPHLAPLRPLLARLQDLKRVRTADAPARSLADRWFARAWGDLAAGADPAAVARRETAAAAAAVELAGIDPGVLRRGGLDDRAIEDVFRAAVRRAAPDPEAEARLAAAVPDLVRGLGRHDRTAPGFTVRLKDQPRAGATHPTKPRLVLDPPESHAAHCYVVAVSAALLAGPYGADPTAPFLAGLGHHLHNARLPDAGFAGEELLGEHLRPLADRFAAEALDELPPALADRVTAALERTRTPDEPEGKAFHAADVLDRVLWMEGYEKAAAFRLAYAMDDLELVHPGPTQAFLNEVLTAAGVWPR
jgi:5'-deoxynucleotidase YfbR-like HD superfamily hydrolase